MYTVALLLQWRLSKIGFRNFNVAKIELGYESSINSLDLTLYDFYLFPNLKNSFVGQKCKSNEEVIVATEANFAAFK